MKQLVNFLKGTIDKNADGIYKCLIINNEQIYTYGRAMSGGGIFSAILPMTCCVPFDELESALSRMKTDPEIYLEDQTLTLKSGKFRSTIRCYDLEIPKPLLGNVEWQPCPLLFSLAIRKALLFIGDKGVFAGIRIRGDEVTAMNQTGAVKVTVKDLNSNIDVSIAKETAEFLAKQASPSQISFSENMIACKWNDGKWFRSPVLANGFPDSVDTLFERTDNKAPIYITEEWRNAFDDISATCDGNITIHSGGFIGTKGVGRTDFEFQTGVNGNHVSRWSTRALKPMLESGAVRWNPEAYPNLARFEGTDFCGVIMGLQQ